MKNLIDICNEGLLNIPDNFDSYAKDTKHSIEMTKLASKYIDLNDFELDTKNLVLTPKGRDKIIYLTTEDKLPIIYYTYRNRKFKSILNLMDRGFSFDADIKIKLTKNFAKSASKLSHYNFAGEHHILYVQAPETYGTYTTEKEMITLSKFLDNIKSFDTIYMVNDMDCNISKYLNNLDIENIIFSMKNECDLNDLHIQNMKCKNLWLTYCGNFMDLCLVKDKYGYDANTTIEEVLTDFEKYLKEGKRIPSTYKFVSDVLANLKFTIKHNPYSNIICSFAGENNPYILTLDLNDNLTFTKSNIKL